MRPDEAECSYSATSRFRPGTTGFLELEVAVAVDIVALGGGVLSTVTTAVGADLTTATGTDLVVPHLVAAVVGGRLAVVGIIEVAGVSLVVLGTDAVATALDAVVTAVGGLRLGDEDDASIFQLAGDGLVPGAGSKVHALLDVLGKVLAVVEVVGSSQDGAVLALARALAGTGGNTLVDDTEGLEAVVEDVDALGGGLGLGARLLGDGLALGKILESWQKCAGGTTGQTWRQRRQRGSTSSRHS